MKKLWQNKRLAAGYVTVLFACLAVALIAGWTAVAARIDNYAYDFLFGLYPQPTRTPQSAVLAIDEETFRDTPG